MGIIFFKKTNSTEYFMFVLNRNYQGNIRKQSYKDLGNFLSNLSHSISCLHFGTLILFL